MLEKLMTQAPDLPVVKATDLTKKYGAFTALDKLSIELLKGQILGFIGPNGAGKTTTIKILVGLAKPTAGEAYIVGCNCTTESKKIKRLVGYMPDTFGAYDNMRVQEYLDFFGAAFAIPRKQRRTRIDWVLETTGATHMRDLFVESLSHGMKQRIGIARTLLHDPPVLILDEPANGLDPTARVEMRQILLKLADMGKTLIVTSHILPELSRICNVVAIITGGKLRAFGSLDTIMHDLRQKRLFEVQLAGTADAAAAAARLSDLLGTSVPVEASQVEGLLRFSTTLADEELAHVLRELIARGVMVTQFREVQQDLEDAFLSVTRAAAEQDRLAADVPAPAAGGAVS
ncbi:MAG: ABC transporter ATP-binding protein [Phycisphaerales bacterium]|nr:ABC transporter ATP-binding protein [Phycisphaerales bacterium]